VHWIQTEAPRPRRRTGLSGISCAGDITGTKNGLAKYAYIRESRAIKAEFTVLEQHVASTIRPKVREVSRIASGIGCYRIDLPSQRPWPELHRCRSWPFQIPLGSLIPQRVENYCLRAKTWA
jgi:hypothetical protein